MKSKLLAITLLTSTTLLSYSGTTFAQMCYQAGGTVTTENVTPTLQIGNIDLTLSDSNGAAFNETGSLVGNITGAEGAGVILLSHAAKFPKGNNFVTNADKAFIVGVRLYDDFGNFLVDEEGNFCSFLIHESITEIAGGTRFFKNVIEVSISADGYISNCPAENNNYFELSGSLCVE
jgi:hypothetical protein